jgi:mono/diheme cytochrome c family protein
MKLIGLMDVRPDGAGYVAHDGFNLVASTDEWMSPVFAEVGPDGAVWFADFQNFIIQHNPTPSQGSGGYDAKTGVGGAHENPLRDHERGRIYRVVWNQAKKPAITSLKGASDDALVGALGSDNQFWRLKAQQMLVEGAKKSAVPSLKKVVAANDGNIAAIHALWSLHGLGELDESTHRAALLGRDGGLRRNAVRALGSDAAAQSLLFGSGTLSDPDAATRLAAMVKLAEFPTSPEITTLVGRSSSDPVILKDEWLAEAARLLSQKHNPFKEGANVLANSGFEEAEGGLPVAWKEENYGTAPGNPGSAWQVVGDAKHAGAASLHLEGKGGFTEKAMVIKADLKPNTYYRLAAWIRTEELHGRAFIVDRARGTEIPPVSGTTDWREIDMLFNSGDIPRADLHLVFAAEKGKAWFDDVRLIEMLPLDSGEAQAGDAKRGEAIFWKHPVAACMNCHMLDGKGSTVGPALDGIASLKDEAYLLESLVNPNAALAKGFDQVPVSPMPPMGLILKPQELADVLAFLKGLKK